MNEATPEESRLADLPSWILVVPDRSMIPDHAVERLASAGHLTEEGPCAAPR